MRKHYSLPLPIMVYFLLMSLFLQSCGSDPFNLPIKGEEEPAETTTIEQEGQQGRRKRARIEKETEEEGKQNLIGYQQERNVAPGLIPDVWQHIFSYLDFEGVLQARAVSCDWNELITGFRQVAVVGVENKPHYIVGARGWTKNKDIDLSIDFSNKNLCELTPISIPSFAFYQLMGSVKNLPQEFWPYLKDSQIHTLDLSMNHQEDEGLTELGEYLHGEGVAELAKHLQGSNVNTLDLSDNDMGAQEAATLSKHLQGTNVHTLTLKCNKIGDCCYCAEEEEEEEACEAHKEKLVKRLQDFVKHLQRTNVHTLDLSENQIDGEGATAIAKHLQETNVQILDLSFNPIEVEGAEALAQVLAQSQVHTLNLSDNEIRDEGAMALAKHLQGSRIHTLDLSSCNFIDVATKQLLQEQYPHINWEF